MANAAGHGLPPEEYDLIVAGAGAAGFAAGVTAAAAGLRVLIVEKSAYFGGTTCSSAGILWIPGSRQAREAGIADDADRALRYLEAEAGERLDRERASAFVTHAAATLEWFERNTHLRYALVAAWPDYHPELPGGMPGGRSLGPLPFDGRALGERLARLRPPLATTTILGGMIVGREDVGRFYTMTRSWASAAHVARLVARYARDRVAHSRGTRLSNGSALIAMLARSAFERGIDLWLDSPLEELSRTDGRVVGVVVRTAAGRREVRARAGVVIATGGFPASAALTARHYAHVREGRAHRTLAPESNTGDGIEIAQRAGVAVDDALHAPAAWTPVSLVPQRDGTTLPYPHFLDRGKAGYVAVDARGRRFIAEALSYHDFVPALLEATRGQREAACHLVCDAAAIRRYGLGRAPPAPGRLAPHLRSGYLKRGDTLEALARECGIDAAGLRATVERFNAGAVRGEDPEFGKGSDVYQRFNGSAGVAPNPCVAPLATPPFYAVKLYAGCIGTFAGLRVDAHCRALDSAGRPIEGLWVVGNDAASVMGGRYPGAGITLGPALVFGHLAARDAAARSVARGAPPA